MFLNTFLRLTITLFFLIITLSGCVKHNSVTNLNLKKNWSFSEYSDTTWLPAKVPGTVHTDLIHNRIIENPFFRLNEHNVQWIDKKDWRYRTILNIDKNTFQSQNVVIDFKGLDTYANVFLNDSCILRSDNMFRSYVVDVKNILKLGENQLEIIFDSPIKRGLERREKIGYEIPISGNDLAEIGKVSGGKRVSVFNRKAGYHFGWDWGPRLVTSGIWKPIFLKSWNDFKIDDVYIKQELQEKKAIINTQVELSFDDKYNEKDLNLEIKISDDNDFTVYKKTKIKIDSKLNIYNIPLEITHPKLWWPNGMGDPYLYNVEVSVSDKYSKDIKSLKLGLRTIELVREPDSIGTSFYFRVNGHPVFMKGVNYIPQDIFLTRPTQNDYEYILSSAAQANMNMIRVWGGGVYEKDEFYDLCDQKGLLVWQDFMFACAMYPGNDSFLENVKQEAIYNIKRLRNHPSLALWCGNNEVLTAWENWGWRENEIKNQSQEIADTIFMAYENIFHEILPEAVNKYDSKTSYWPSSPGSGFGKKQKLESGNAHYWWVWWGKKPFSSYNDSIPRFMAEFGFQSFPEFSSVIKYTNDSDYDIYSDVMKSHQRSSIGNETIEEYLVRDYKKPKDFENYLYVSQLLQAEGIKTGIEAHRRNRHRCMGSLYWQLNDCWPVASWSGIDYYGKWKALHYRVKDAFSNFLVSHNFNKDTLELFVVSDSLVDINATIKVELLDFEGTQIDKKEKQIIAKANHSEMVMKIHLNQFVDSIFFDNTFLNVSILDAQLNVLADNKIFLNSFKDLKLPKSDIIYDVEIRNDYFVVDIKSKKFAKNVFVSSKLESNFSDNYFDLMPKEVKTIKIKNVSDLTVDEFKKNLKFLTLDKSSG